MIAIWGQIVIRIRDPRILLLDARRIAYRIGGRS